MRIYVLIPHQWKSWDDVSIFGSFAAVEQTALIGAQRRNIEGEDPDWCCIIAYDGDDELYPVFLYTVRSPTHLHREPWAIPSP